MDIPLVNVDILVKLVFLKAVIYYSVMIFYRPYTSNSYVHDMQMNFMWKTSKYTKTKCNHLFLRW